MVENLLRRGTQWPFWRVPFWYYEQRVGPLSDLKKSVSQMRAVWPTVSNSRSLKALSQPDNDYYWNITDLGQCTAFCWGRRVTVRKATTMQRKVSLGNGCDPLFGTRAWNIIVIREYFPNETGALPGMMLGLHIFHYGSGLSKAVVLSFQWQE